MNLFTEGRFAAQNPYLARALSLAERGRGTTAPNPLVGCVLVREDSVVGEGFHAFAGGPHAEVNALREAGENARGATAYVTLEPCSHHGRTPPCTEALIDAGVSRVVIGLKDPTAQAGGGARILSDAGIHVRFDDDPEPFSAVNEGWLKRMSTGLPFVTAKLGLSLDGRISLGAQVRSAMTGEAGARVTQLLRRRSDAVMVGGSTARCDDPRLTTRDADGAPSPVQPLRVILAGRRMPEAHCSLYTDAASRTLIVARDDLDLQIPPGVEVGRYGAEDGLEGALRVLGDRGINDVLVEPGSELFRAMWDGRLIDRLVTVMAGGVAGEGGTTIYPAAQAASSRLEHRYRAVEAAIVEGVSVTVWSPSPDPDAPQGV